MPQMNPMWWTFLFIMFSMTLVFFALMNYFENTPRKIPSPLLHVSSSLNTFNWKW